MPQSFMKFPPEVIAANKCKGLIIAAKSISILAEQAK